MPKMLTVSGYIVFETLSFLKPHKLKIKSGIIWFTNSKTDFWIVACPIHCNQGQYRTCCFRCCNNIFLFLVYFWYSMLWASRILFILLVVGIEGLHILCLFEIWGILIYKWFYISGCLESAFICLLLLSVLIYNCIGGII